MAEHLAQADPTLDEDLRLFLDPDCPLPRLYVLGPVNAKTRGTAMASRKPYWTELLTYLTTRPHGATPDEVATAFNITPAKAREYVRTVREWLGTNPRTGDKHLPDARHTPAARQRGIPVYQVQDVLEDRDLFLRLRLRGQTRGPEGIADLRAALQLVHGRPYDQLRPGGWAWMLEEHRLDEEMKIAITDVAHILTTHALHEGDLRQARLAAETALLAAPDEEITKLSLAAVIHAEGDPDHANQLIRDDICNRTDDDQTPVDLPARTKQILTDHDWPARASTAC